MNIFRRVISILTVIMVIILILTGIVAAVTLSKYSYNLGYQVFLDKPIKANDKSTITVNLKSGISAGELANLLYEKGLSKDKLVTYLQFKLLSNKNEIISGEYQLSPNMTPEQIFRIITGQG